MRYRLPSRIVLAMVLAFGVVFPLRAVSAQDIARDTRHGIAFEAVAPEAGANYGMTLLGPREGVAKLAAARDQAHDYALDLKNFHHGSHALWRP